MLVTDRGRTASRDLRSCVVRAVAGGVGRLQLREKDLSSQALLRLADGLRDVLPAGLPIAVNGEASVAEKLRLGWHLPAAMGQVDAAERCRWPFTGRSVHSIAEARVARSEGASYVVAGTIFETSSKPGRPGQGTAIITELRDFLHPTPIFAIGGIDADRVAEVLRAGAHGVAVCGAILSAPDPREAARAIVRAIRRVSRHGA